MIFISRQPFCRYILTIILGLGFAALASSPAIHAQQTGSSVDECSSGIVDSNTGVEQTVCLYGDLSGLTGTVEVDCCTGNSWYWADGEGVSGYINSTYIADQCCAESESAWGFVVPQLNTWYYLTGYFDENICDGDNNCSWSYGNSGLSVSVEVTGTPPPAAPTGLSAAPGNGQVSLTWAASSGATSYNVYEGSSPGGESSSPIATGIAGTSYTLTGLNNGSNYYFTVAAVSSSGVSGYSNEASATPRSLIYSYSANYDGTGSVTSYNDSVNGTWTNVAYDNLSRLAAATWTPVSGSPESFCWTFDNFGNMTAEAGSNQPFANSPGASACQVASGATLLSNNWSAYSSSTGNNQITATSLMSAGPLNYDAAGNVQKDNLNEYAYDGEGRICAIENLYSGAVTQYIYDADGNRVAKGTAHTILVSGVYVLSCDTTQNGFTATNLYVIGPSGEQLTETDGQGNWKHTNVYAAGELAATYDADPSSGTKALHFHFSDWLSTRRAQTDYAGNVEEICTSWPFGDQLNCQQTTLATADDATEHHFTSKERDSESENDYFEARYYASSLGRFLSPDYSPVDDGPPDAIPFGSVSSPQSLNGYAYVDNNPLGGTDSDGHDCVLQSRIDDRHESVSVSSGTCAGVSVKSGQSATYIAGTVDRSSIQSDGSGGITFGYTSYSGDGGVGDLKGAPVFDNPGIDGPVNAAIFGRIGREGMSGIETFAAASVAVAGCIAGCPAAATATVATIRAIVTAAPLVLPAGAKVAQMIARAGPEFRGDPEAFLEHAKELISEAQEAGTFVETNYGIVYRVGQTYLVVKDAVLTSFVPNAEAGRGIVTSYIAHGGK